MSNIDMGKDLRILVVDDTRKIRDDFRKILSPTRTGDILASAETLLFNAPGHAKRPMFEIDSAFKAKKGWISWNRQFKKDVLLPWPSWTDTWKTPSET